MIFSEAAWLSMNKNQIQILSIQEVIWLLQSQFISRFRMEARKNKKMDRYTPQVTRSDFTIGFS